MSMAFSPSARSCTSRKLVLSLTNWYVLAPSMSLRWSGGCGDSPKCTIADYTGVSDAQCTSEPVACAGTGRPVKTEIGFKPCELHQWLAQEAKTNENCVIQPVPHGKSRRLVQHINVAPQQMRDAPHFASSDTAFEFADEIPAPSFYWTDEVFWLRLQRTAAGLTTALYQQLQRP